MLDTAGHWCVAFAADSLRPGERVTIVFPDSANRTVGLRGRLLGRRATPCWAAFPQQSLTDYATYDVSITDPILPSASGSSGVALALVSDVPWRRAADGVARADLDGDGKLEEASACAVDEGERFSLYSRDPVSDVRRSVWQGYYDWGALVDVTCTPDGN